MQICVAGSTRLNVQQYRLKKDAIDAHSTSGMWRRILLEIRFEFMQTSQRQAQGPYSTPSMTCSPCALRCSWCLLAQASTPKVQRPSTAMNTAEVMVVTDLLPEPLPPSWPLDVIIRVEAMLRFNISE